jgi:hypothetical protein
MASAELFNKSDDIIDELVNSSDKSLKGLSERLVKLIQDKLVSQFDYEGGKLAQTEKNYMLIAEIDKVMDAFSERYANLLANLGTGTSTMSEQLSKYYLSLGFSTKLVGQAQKETGNIANKILGIDSKGNPIKGGYISELAKASPVRADLKNYVFTALNSNADLKTFQKGFSELITGEKGAMQTYQKQYTHDVYFGTQRAVDKTFADTIGIDYFIYAGTKIETSRPFCAGGYDKVCDCKFDSKINEVFTRAEIMQWDKKNWSGKSDPYNPFTDMGGYRCRHRLRPITKTIAEYIRPDLKK